MPRKKAPSLPPVPEGVPVTLAEAKEKWPEVDFSRPLTWWKNHGQKEKLAELNKWGNAALASLLPAAIERVKDSLNSDDERVAQRAAEVLLERVMGKAVENVNMQAVTVHANAAPPADLSRLSIEELKAYRALVAKTAPAEVIDVTPDADPADT